MSYMLDTNICVAIIRRRAPHALQRLTEQIIGTVCVSSLTVAELEYSVAKSSQPAQNQRALEQFLLPLAIVPFDEQDAQEYGRVRAALEAQGQPIGAIDTLLAAQALRHALTLVTNNMREFARLPGLLLEDWTQPRIAE
jgi:tRNA(fMet)-specific endonuclease VapC